MQKYEIWIETRMKKIESFVIEDSIYEKKNIFIMISPEQNRNKKIQPIKI